MGQVRINGAQAEYCARLVATKRDEDLDIDGRGGLNMEARADRTADGEALGDACGFQIPEREQHSLECHG